MKNILWCVPLMLCACASREFDQTEYKYAIESAVLSTRAIHQCASKSPRYDEFIQDLNTQTMYLFEYEKHLPSNAHALNGVTNLRQLVLDFMKSTEHTSTYCVHKLSEIQSASRTVARMMSGMGYMDMCSSDAMSRLSLYQQSFQDKNITQGEYAELVHDLSRLTSIDESVCSIQEREALLQAISAISKVVNALK